MGGLSLSQLIPPLDERDLHFVIFHLAGVRWSPPDDLRMFQPFYGGGIFYGVDNKVFMADLLDDVTLIVEDDDLANAWAHCL